MSSPTRRDIGEIDKIEMKHIEWRIPNIFADAEDPNGYLYVSPNFFTGDAAWHLRLLRSGRRKNTTIEIAIVTEKNAMREYSMKYIFGLKKSDDTVDELCFGILDGDKDWSSWEDLIQQSKLLRQKNLWAPSDILTVTCTLKWKPEISHLNEPTVLDVTKLMKLTSKL